MYTLLLRSWPPISIILFFDLSFHKAFWLERPSFLNQSQFIHSFLLSLPPSPPSSPPSFSFYSSYQGIKYISKVARDEDDWGNPATAAFMTVAPLLVSATFRRNVPYAVLLIGMDVFSEATASTPSSTTTTTT